MDSDDYSTNERLRKLKLISKINTVFEKESNHKLKYTRIIHEEIAI